MKEKAESMISKFSSIFIMMASISTSPPLSLLGAISSPSYGLLVVNLCITIQNQVKVHRSYLNHSHHQMFSSPDLWF